jgi:hypothetical protein
VYTAPLLNTCLPSAAARYSNRPSPDGPSTMPKTLPNLDRKTNDAWPPAVHSSRTPAGFGATRANRTLRKARQTLRVTKQRFPRWRPPHDVRASHQGYDSPSRSQARTRYR